MSDHRDKIARALFDHDYNGVTQRASDTAWLRVRDRTDDDSTWHRAADAVLAVIDLDEVRANAARRYWPVMNKHLRKAKIDRMLAQAWDEGYDYRTVEYRQHEEERVNPYRKAEK